MGRKINLWTFKPTNNDIFYKKTWIWLSVMERLHTHSWTHPNSVLIESQVH